MGSEVFSEREGVMERPANNGLLFFCENWSWVSNKLPTKCLFESRFTGVNFSVQSNKWRAKIFADGKQYNLGYFTPGEEGGHMIFDFLHFLLINHHDWQSIMARTGALSDFRKSWCKSKQWKFMKAQRQRKRGASSENGGRAMYAIYFKLSLRLRPLRHQTDRLDTVVFWGEKLGCSI